MCLAYTYEYMQEHDTEDRIFDIPFIGENIPFAEK